ncbi:MULTISPECIES: 30S ribosome-binding factor RbfA [Breznakia]|uniref:Ribosome-binding factor A n=1 Tax=Breznakia blatticola TaxID=1754012 RepID=A0A4R8A8W6_9FIRM|nr:MULTISPECIES: 30S ribosome-binding factor RbfA [Breznakia]MDH6366063.1 ribosome-binding factor A [Breznakia sp. PH1-1]MDH6403005.1 ribosome-binding factor A [Breznakia sp. PF1-11]MDH6410714.1 ribosome-binding factor A [Breznakia sp. PFB1-11]MDH6413229.1 ribosome-binding factor A [Breznakia sp. PFB1-14]MDH6415597.1 ribosome-binding factor A [Breznakia sp. PFB1-4]
MSIKKERVAGLIQKNISEIIQRAVKDPKVGFVTVMDTQVTSDLSLAKVYVSFLGKDARKEAGMDALNRSKGFIRSELAKTLSMRKVPELEFVLDESLEQGNKIEQIIADLHKKEK